MSDPIGPGALVAVVGASGVGKDALLSYARDRTTDVADYPRRFVTRPSGPGEDHEPMTDEAFSAARTAGGFAFSWSAHGLEYGIPVEADDAVRAGRVVVANVSRAVLTTLDERYERLVVVRVTVSDAVRAERLRGRRRETGDEIVARMARVDPAPDHRVDVEIVNDGALEEGGEVLVRAVRVVAEVPGPRPSSAITLC